MNFLTQNNFIILSKWLNPFLINAYYLLLIKIIIFFTLNSIATLLITAGATLMDLDNQKMNCLHSAALNGRAEMQNLFYKPH